MKLWPLLLPEWCSPWSRDHELFAPRGYEIVVHFGHREVHKVPDIFSEELELLHLHGLTSEPGCFACFKGISS